jgi:hypothetical protein
VSEPNQPNNNPGPWNAPQGPGQQAPQSPPQGVSPYPGPQTGQPQGYAYPGSPYGQMAPAEEPARPKQINLAFWFLIGSAVAGLIALPLSIAWMNSPEYLEYLETVARDLGVDVDPTYLSASIASATATSVVSGIIGLAVRVGLAFLVRAGFNWARIVITIFAVLSLFSLIGLFVTGPVVGVLNLAAIAATIAAVVLLFMKPSSEYFARKKAYRQAQKFGGYQA